MPAQTSSSDRARGGGAAPKPRRNAPPVLVRQLRNGIEESVHRGDIVEVDAAGRMIHVLGDPDHLVNLRSCVKPFGVVAILDAGGQKAFGLEPAEIAIMASSHSGEDLHVRTLQAMYRRTGVSQAALATGIAWVLLNRTALGSYVRSIGADTEGARRVGVPTRAVTWSVYALCGAFAGLGGFISLSQSSAASGAFGQGAEFLAIAAAVLGGTSLFGGRGNLWAPVIGAVLIMTVQNGLVMMNANPYAYPVITGSVIFLAALFDSIRSRLQAKLERHSIRPEPRPDKAPTFQPLPAETSTRGQS